VCVAVRNFPGYRPISSLFLSILSNTTIGYRLARARYPCFMFTYCGASKQVPVGLTENRETLKGAGIAGQYRFYDMLSCGLFIIERGVLTAKLNNDGRWRNRAYSSRPESRPLCSINEMIPATRAPNVRRTCVEGESQTT